MKYKSRVAAILILSTICLLVGITIAYYNTASFGYDNANIISINNYYIRIFDVSISRAFIKNIIEILHTIISDYISMI